jgi:HSP20 family protein
MAEQRMQPQDVPVRIYQSEHRLMVVAPLPGLEPDDISVTIDGTAVAIRGERRGSHQNDVELLSAEWKIGSYQRDVTLPMPVDGEHCNASYGNGVLVLALPKLAPDQTSTRVEFRLRMIEPARGEHVGHVGRDLRPETTERHEEKAREMARVGSASDQSSLVDEIYSGDLPPGYMP